MYCWPYGIDASRVVRHNDISGKHCPGIIGWNADSGDESKWRAFKSRIGGSYTAPITSFTTSSTLLKKGSKGDAVKTMQTLLIAAGYGCGSCGADGIFGNDTLFALMAFQQDYGLDVDGMYGPKSKTALESVTTTANLKKGSNGDSVKMMQMMLTACGYDTHGVDGIFGNNTLNALRAYQSAHGLAVDGIYGKNSRASLTQAYQAMH